MYSRDTRLSMVQDSLCGAVSGAVARSLTAPLDVTKVLYQVGVSSANERAYVPGGLYNLGKHVYNTEGIRALFKGNFTSCLKMFPVSVIQYGTYFGLRSHFADDKGNLSMLETTFCSAIAGYTAIACTYPLDTIKTRMIVQPYNKKESAYTGIVDCWRKIWVLEGKFAIWRGLSAPLLATIPSTVSLFVTYELLQRHSRWRSDIPGVMEESFTEGKRITHGFTAAMVSLIVTHPFDTCRKKMQAYSNVQSNHGGVDFAVKGLRHCWRHICQTQTPLGLYAGFAPAVIRLVPFNTVLFFTYTLCKDKCLDYNGFSLEELERGEAHHLEDRLDREYMHTDDLLNNEPPVQRQPNMYAVEKKHMENLERKGKKAKVVEEKKIKD